MEEADLSFCSSFQTRFSYLDSDSEDSAESCIGGEKMKYDFDTIVERRGTHCIKWDREECVNDPKLLPLYVADMDFQTAPCIREALMKAAGHGVYGYTMVWDGYRKAVADWMDRRHDLRIEKEWILTFPGIVPAIKLAVRTFTRPEDQILIFKPVYYPFDLSIESNGRKVVECVLDEKDGVYTISFDRLEQILKENDIRMLIFCNPHNPIGRVWTKEELKRLGKLCLKYHVFVFSDEIHMDFEYGDHRFVSMLSAVPELAGQMIVATAPSKTFNLAGLSVSNLIIADHTIYEKLKNEMDQSGISVPNMFGLTACEAAYTQGEDWLDELLVYIEGNFEFMQDWFASNLPQVKMRKPEGLYLAWADFRDLFDDPDELENFMLKEAHVWLDEGYIFGTGGEGFERFNCACPRSVLKEALERIETAWNDRQKSAQSVSTEKDRD